MDGGKHVKPKEPGKIRGFLDKFKIRKPKHQVDVQEPASPVLRVLGGRDVTSSQEFPAVEQTTPATDNAGSTAPLPTEKKSTPTAATPTAAESTKETPSAPAAQPEISVPVENVSEKTGQPASEKKSARKQEQPTDNEKASETPRPLEEQPQDETQEETAKHTNTPAASPDEQKQEKANKQHEKAKLIEQRKAENAAEKVRQAAAKKAAKDEKKALAQKKASEKKQAKAEKAVQKPKRYLDPAKVAKAAYRIGIAFLVVVIGLSLWLGRETYTLSGLQSWFQLEFTGLGEGDGFPVKIKGHTINQNNFTHVGSNVAALSNTALTVYNQSGKEQYTVRHSFENPGMSHVGEQFILYDIGGSKYTVQNGAKTKQDVQIKEDILAAAISQSGVYALAVEKDGYASWIDVYASDGTKKYYYHFSQQYVTSLAINADGTRGVICALTSENGTLQSIITVLDFNQDTPLYEHKLSGNMLIDVYWGENNVIYAIGDKSFLWSSGGENFEEYSYGGQQLTAYQLEGSWAAISISNNAYAGESTLLSFTGTDQPLQIEFPQHVSSISSFGSMIGALYGDTVGFYDKTTGRLMGESTGNDDIKSIALSNERSAYTLAISEIRLVVAQSSTQ